MPIIRPINFRYFFRKSPKMTFSDDHENHKNDIMSPFYALNFHFISLNTIRMLGIDCANYSCRYPITNYDDVSVQLYALFRVSTQKEALSTPAYTCRLRC